MSDNKQQTKDFERIGRNLEQVVAQGYVNKRRLIIFSLIRGLATGVGSVVGASLAFVLIIWILSLFSDIPLIGDVFENVRKTIQKVPTN